MRLNGRCAVFLALLMAAACGSGQESWYPRTGHGPISPHRDIPPDLYLADPPFLLPNDGGLGRRAGQTGRRAEGQIPALCGLSSSSI